MTTAQLTNLAKENGMTIISEIQINWVSNRNGISTYNVKFDYRFDGDRSRYTFSTFHEGSTQEIVLQKASKHIA